MTKIVPILFLLSLFYTCSSPSNKVENKTTKSAETIVEAYAEPFIPELPKQLHEISGLLIYDQLFWGFNDSGGEAKLCAFNKKGAIKRETEIDGVENIDWESITQDADNIYIGDFGNNNGYRKNLRILKLNKANFSKGAEHTIEAEKIGFEYDKQDTFGYAPISTPFDCEAMISFSNALYIFSKDWQRGTTVSYKIPKEAGKYRLTALDTFNVRGFITGADVSPDKKRLALLGYADYHTFIWLFTDFVNDDFFGGESLRIEIPNLDDAQSEGISFWGNDSLLVSCENSRGIKQQVFVVDLLKLNHGTYQDK